MMKTTNMTDTGSLMMSHAAHAGWAADLKSGQPEGANLDYYRAYYCALVTKRAERIERSRRLEAIKMQRRKSRREKWLQNIKSLASVSSGTEAMS